VCQNDQRLDDDDTGFWTLVDNALDAKQIRSNLARAWAGRVVVGGICLLCLFLEKNKKQLGGQPLYIPGPQEPTRKKNGLPPGLVEKAAPAGRLFFFVRFCCPLLLFNKEKGAEQYYIPPPEEPTGIKKMAAASFFQKGRPLFFCFSLLSFVSVFYKRHGVEQYCFLPPELGAGIEQTLIRARKVS
jgi:hypothetical protein